MGLVGLHSFDFGVLGMDGVLTLTEAVLEFGQVYLEFIVILLYQSLEF